MKGRELLYTGGEQAEVALVVSTCKRFEPYLDMFLRLIDQNWPQRPELWVQSDGDGASGRPFLHVSHRQWIPAALEMMRELLTHRPKLRYVFLLLEDLAPFSLVDPVAIEQSLLAAIDLQLPLVSYPTYPFDNRGHEKLVHGDAVFYEVFRDFKYYSQLQPGLWSVPHFLDTLERGLAEGKHSPWEFEFLNYGGPHYNSAYNWPNVLNGLFVSGEVNWHALLEVDVRVAPKEVLTLWTRLAAERPVAFTKRAAGYLHRRALRLAGRRPVQS